MTENATNLKLENELSVSIDYPVVRKRFRVTIDVEATLGADSRRALPTAPQDVPQIRALMELLLAQPEIVDRLLRCRTVEVTRQAVKRLGVEYGWGGISEDELLGPIFAELEPDARAYFTEELENGVRVYYFDGYNATVEGASVARIDKG
jgi:hypothetical protein